jgi:hypothetical protein
VAVRPASAQQIDALVADLRAGDAIARESALARLTVIGPRAVARILAVAESGAPAAARAAAVVALEAVGGGRARAGILRLVDDADPELASAAIASARGYLRERHGADVLDRLTRAALDRSRDARVRMAALRAVAELDAATIAPLLDALREDPDAGVRALAQPSVLRGTRAFRHPAATLAAAAAGELPDDAGVLREAIVRAGRSAALPALLDVIEAVRKREQQEPAGGRSAWTAARASAHLALATRGSRLALYDLRESLETADARLPVELLAALSAVGDAACLAAIAAAHARSRDAWWRAHLADAFHVIVTREGVTRRHAAMKKIEKRWPEFWSLVVRR